MSKQSTEHTALPWRIGDAGTTVFGPPNGNPSPVTVAHTTRANAAYIVRACNSHAALVSALRDICATYRTFRNVPQDEQQWSESDDQALEAGFAALSAAQGVSE